jgi:pimeloyl-ACP methyl ester carboxylesterase
VITDLVLVHGFWSSPATWDRLAARIRDEPELRGLNVHRFGYPSPRLRLPGQPSRIPDYDDIAQTFPAFLEAHLTGDANVAIVTHSQGGLILQRFLAWMLSEGRGRDLVRIRLIIMLSCPNEGSEYLRSIRAVLKFNSQPQAKSLRVLDADVSAARRIVLRQIINSTAVDERNCPIPFYVYSGSSDNVVRRASGQSVFPHAGVLPGDHLSILDPDAPGSLTLSALKQHLLTPAAESKPTAGRVQGPAELPVSFDAELAGLDRNRASRETASTAPDQAPVKAVHDLKSEVITLKFDTLGDLIADAGLPILEDYEADLNRGFLDGYIFTENQLTLLNPPAHERLTVNFYQDGRRSDQRRVREMEDWYARGTVALLNLLFSGARQTSYAWRSIYWFNRAVRHLHVTIMRASLPEYLRGGGYGEGFSPGPLGGVTAEVESFYGESMIRVNLWDPANPDESIQCLFPRTGAAGSWFTQHPLSPGEYYPRHFSPTEYYEFLIPQMMLRHIAQHGKLISDFKKYNIGAA